MPKIPSETSSNKTQRRTARISVRPCCLINLTSSNEPAPLRNFSPLNDYNIAPPSTPLESPPKTTLAPQDTSPIQTLTTLKVTPPSLTTPPPVPTQPSKQTPLHATDLEPLKLIFSTPPTSPYPFFDTLEDLPLRSTNPPHLPSFKSIKCMANQPPLLSKIMYVKSPLPPFPPQFPQPQPFLPIDQSMWINGPSPPPIHHEHLCEHCQQTQTIAYEEHDEMQFILNHILNRPNDITHQNNFPQTLMTTLAEHIIVVGAENHPLMLEKSMYDSWASRICLFIKGKKYGTMMLDSIDNGPLVDPTVEENGQTRPMKYSELTKAQQLQDDYDQREDPIECINKVMAFLSAVASRFPPSNNQLRTSCNPRNQATIQDGRVIVQQVKGRQTQSYVGTGNRGIATTSKGNFIAGQQRVMKCYIYQGEGHIARHCTQLKRPRNAAWFKEKLMLAEAQEAEAPVDQQRNPQNSAFQTKYLDAYDSDCDDLSSAAILMANLLSCDPEVLYEDTNSSAPTDLLVLSLVEQMTDHVAHLDKENQTNKMVNESLTAELERYKERVAIFKQRLNVDLNKREKLIDSQMDDLIWDRNAKLAAS
ncbi:hypothetical protein Tco_1509405 [Tanacetum coccineum]